MDVDRQLLHEESKKIKMERKLRLVEEENQKLRTMLNYVLNLEF